MDFVGDGPAKGSDEVRGDASGRPFMQFDKGELRSPVDSHEEIQLAFLSTNFGNVDVK